MASKNRRRKGISGNPQRRAEQLAERRPASPPLPTASERSVLDELSYAAAGGAEPRSWWSESHERILATAEALAWPSRPIDLETQACRIAGDEFYERLESADGGRDPSQWLRALAEETGAELRASITDGTGEWQKLWALLCGLALMTPRRGAESAAMTRHRASFADVKDPYRTAMAEVAKTAKLLANRGLASDISYPDDDFWVAGEPLVARDVYGSRFLVVAPFSYHGQVPDHWYAWDIDLCWLHHVVGAGVFDSADAALAEWREAVGPAAGASLTPGTPDVTAQLLAPYLRTSQDEMLHSDAPRELIREFHRLRRRAQILGGSAGTATAPSDDDAASVRQAFLDWYAARHDGIPQQVTDAVDTIIYEWGPPSDPGGISLYACSPHRIQMTAHLIRDGVTPQYANPAIQMLPEWTQWCIERGGLAGDFAARSRGAALSEAGILVDEEDSDSAAEEPEGPFRRRE